MDVEYAQRITERLERLERKVDLMIRSYIAMERDARHIHDEMALQIAFIEQEVDRIELSLSRLVKEVEHLVHAFERVAMQESLELAERKVAQLNFSEWVTPRFFERMKKEVKHV